MHFLPHTTADTNDIEFRLEATRIQDNYATHRITNDSKAGSVVTATGELFILVVVQQGLANSYV